MDLRSIALLSLLCPAWVAAGSLADIEIFDRTAHRTLEIHEHEGRLYVIGEPRHRYELHVRSRSGDRLLAVTSVDGVNVITGKTAATQQSGYVLEPWSSVAIEGWRKSLDDVATFYFTHLRDSYAARTDRPDHVGVIGVALFRERQQPCCRNWHKHAEPSSSADANAPGARQEAERRGDSPLGTGHGHRESSPAQYVDFRRASSTPDETVVIYYDSRQNLIAQGVILEQPTYARGRPDPFPAGFVPDP